MSIVQQDKEQAKSHTVPDTFWDQVQALTKKSAHIADKNERLRMQNQEYINEITKLRTVNEELLQKIYELEQESNPNSEALSEAMDRNTELEELMVSQRREILWMTRENESQSAEMKALRQQCHELKRQIVKQRKLIDHQKREHSKTSGRVQVLRELLVQREPTMSRRNSKSASLEMSTTSGAEDTLMDSMEEDDEAEDGQDSPESDQSATIPAAKRAHPVEGSAENVSAIIRSNGAKSKSSSNSRERKLQKQVDELMTLTQQLSMEKEKLKQERDRWVKFVNIQSQKAQMKGISIWKI